MIIYTESFWTWWVAENGNINTSSSSVACVPYVKKKRVIVHENVSAGHNYTVSKSSPPTII